MVDETDEVDSLDVADLVESVVCEADLFEAAEDAEETVLEVVAALSDAAAVDLVEVVCLAVAEVVVLSLSASAAVDFAALADEVDDNPTVTYPAVGPEKVAEAVT